MSRRLPKSFRIKQNEGWKKAQSKSYLWLYRTSGDTDKLIVLCEYQPRRSGENARSFLSGFKGYLHTDGYAGYHNFSDDITVVGCLAHARRRFDEAVKSLPKDENVVDPITNINIQERKKEIDKILNKLTPPRATDSYHALWPMRTGETHP